MAEVDEVVLVEGVLQEEIDLLVRQLPFAEVDLLEAFTRLFHVQLARVVGVHLLEAFHHRVCSVGPRGACLNGDDICNHTRWYCDGVEVSWKLALT